ncbi:hypothetical protein J7J26_01550 [Candidatus Micrarchaeota archaeon]|nr:hypothetical protein [Candidatus Micrarchaeota archaeon]
MDEDILELEEALTDSGKSNKADNPSSKSTSTSNYNTGGSRPDFRVVQSVTDRDGKRMLVNVGAMWKNVSKNGNEFYTLKIGNLRLLVFPQNK